METIAQVGGSWVPTFVCGFVYAFTLHEPEAKCKLNLILLIACARAHFSSSQADRMAICVLCPFNGKIDRINLILFTAQSQIGAWRAQSKCLRQNLF